MTVAISQVRSLAEGPFLLPKHRAVTDVALACRAAVQDFARSRGAPWTKLELARWLYETYRPLVSITPRGPAISSVPPSRRNVTAGDVDQLMRSTHARLAEILADLEREQDMAFAYQAIREGWIERCQDTRQGRGWLPTARPGMRLLERVLSLLAVDCLVQPRAYDGMTYADGGGGFGFYSEPCPVVTLPSSVTHLTAIR